MTHRTRFFRSAGLVLLALVVLSGGSLAAGDLFDDNYSDCPHKTRLRDGQIADLTLARDAEEETEVNVSWAATDPATWGLGANAYSTSLVVLLDDGENDLQTKTVSLGTQKQTFTGVATGAKVTAQMAIVVDTAEGDYLISDILEASVNQSLTAPSFSSKFLQVVTRSNVDLTNLTDPETREVPNGTFYYVGYNQIFGNYKAATGLITWPRTPRLRIGLAHGGEDDDAREAVDFEAYRMRITDASGDVVSGADDVATVGSLENYRSLYIARLDSYGNSLVPGWNSVFVPVLYIGTSTANLADNERTFGNVRINDGGNITVALQDAPAAEIPFTPISSQTINGVAQMSPAGLSPVITRELYSLEEGNVFVMAPDEHRDFPGDVLSSDETYTVTAWAVNDKGTVSSPVASLKLRPKDAAVPGITTILNYANHSEFGNRRAATVSGVVLTEFTVLK